MSLFARLVVMLAAASSVSAPAFGRQVTTDTGQGGNWGVVESPGCTLDGSIDCNAVDLGFSADFGAGVTNAAYLYDDGLVSFGRKVDGFDAGTVAVMLSRTLSAGLLDPKLYQTAFWEKIDNGVRFSWVDCSSYSELFSGCRPSDTWLTIVKDPATASVLIAGHGDDTYYDQFKYIRELSREEYGFESRRATYGYSLGDQQLPLTRIAAPASASTPVVWDFQVALTAVPEPATWAMMIAGFGLVGGALRRRDGRAVPA